MSPVAEGHGEAVGAVSLCRHCPCIGLVQSPSPSTDLGGRGLGHLRVDGDGVVVEWPFECAASSMPVSDGEDGRQSLWFRGSGLLSYPS